jgi:hypothetical protein
MKIFITLCFCFSSAIAFAADAPGIPPSQTVPADTTLLNKPVQPCKGDIAKFCKGVKKGHGAIIECLAAHKDELSAPCKAQGEAMKTKFQQHGQQIHEACHAELDEYCKDAHAPREIFQCLGSHSEKLSPGCSASLPRHR